MKLLSATLVICALCTTGTNAGHGEVKKIINRRKDGEGNVMYKVKLAGSPPKLEWLPAGSPDLTADLIAEFKAERKKLAEKAKGGAAPSEHVSAADATPPGQVIDIGATLVLTRWTIRHSHSLPQNLSRCVRILPRIYRRQE